MAIALHALQAPSVVFTEPPAPPEPTLLLHLVQAPAVDEFLTQLMDILERNGELTDPLSVALTEWGAAFCDLLSNAPESDEALLEALAERLTALRQLVVNPFDQAPLQNPVMANGRVWESWMLDHVQRLFNGISPFDAQRLEVGAPHPYAAALLQWQEAVLASSDERIALVAARVLAQRAQEVPTGWLDPAAAQAADPEVARQGYLKLARQAVELEGAQRKLRMVRRMDAHYAAVVRATGEGIAHHAALLRAGLQTSGERLEATIRALQEANAAIVHTLRTQLAAARRTNEELLTQVQATEAHATSVELRVGALEGQVRNLRIQNAQNAEAASHSRRGGCAIM